MQSYIQMMYLLYQTKKVFRWLASILNNYLFCNYLTLLDNVVRTDLIQQHISKNVH